MQVRMPIVITALAATFAAGLAFSHFVKEAHAQTTAPFAATVYVPSDGLAFRTFDGRVVARLSYDAHGGMFELFDEHEQPATRVRADAFAHATPGAPAAAPGPASTSRATRDSDLGF